MSVATLCVGPRVIVLQQAPDIAAAVAWSLRYASVSFIDGLFIPMSVNLCSFLVVFCCYFVSQSPDVREAVEPLVALLVLQSQQEGVAPPADVDDMIDTLDNAVSCNVMFNINYLLRNDF